MKNTIRYDKVLALGIKMFPVGSVHGVQGRLI